MTALASDGEMQAHERAPGVSAGQSTGDGNDAPLDDAGGPASSRHVIKDWGWLRSARDYHARIGATVTGMFSAVVSEKEGRYARDLATVRLMRDATGWSLTVGAANGGDAATYAPTESERLLIVAEAASAQWPEHVTPWQADRLPDTLRETEKAGDLFEFRNLPDAAGRSQIIMLQQRVEKPNGDKAYVPWTYWNDCQWRRLEPDGPLPLWGIDQLKTRAIVFLHEGAKAARHVRRMVEAKTPDEKKRLAAHPWGEELKHGAHLGWIGGALSPHRTDWSPLLGTGVVRVVIVADNDAPGLAAVPKIARALAGYPIKVEVLRFDNRWPIGFDLADPFPESMWA